MSARRRRRGHLYSSHPSPRLTLATPKLRGARGGGRAGDAQVLEMLALVGAFGVARTLWQPHDGLGQTRVRFELGVVLAAVLGVLGTRAYLSLAAAAGIDFDDSASPDALGRDELGGEAAAAAATGWPAARAVLAGDRMSLTHVLKPALHVHVTLSTRLF